MLLVLTILSFLLLGRELLLRWWGADSPPFYEFWTVAGVIGTCLWLATVWIAAVLHVMTPAFMVARTLVVFVVAVFLTLTRRSAPPSPAGRERALLGFVLLWVAFILWRGWLLPPVSHDALAYHLPKAVLYARAGGFEPLTFLDPRIGTIPANYEMLLADAVVLQHRDTITEWISTLFYALFVIACGAVAERWWKSKATLVALLAAGVPVALLHSGAHKNDLMTAFFIVAGLVASGRFISERDQRALLVAAAAFAAAIGTKPQAAIVAACIAPFVIWRAKPRQILIAAAVSLAALLLLGGVVFISNYLHPSPSPQKVIVYGDWANLWQGPYTLLAGPFAPHANELPVPWAGRPWFWRRYEVFFSHLGIPFALCAIAMPFAIFALRKRAPAEAFAVTAAALAAFVIMLPVNFQPHGMYAISLPRYALFLVPIVFAWVPQTRVSAGHVLAIVALFAYGIDTAKNDAFAPWGFVQFARQHPGTRQVPFDPFRAAEVMDRRAGQKDRVALDVGFGSWIHPAFGVELSRPVDFIPPGFGPPLIREDADWVVVDRGWNIVWEDPNFRDLSQARSFLMRGRPSAADTRVLDHLRADGRFRLVFYNPAWNQAVFQRIR